MTLDLEKQPLETEMQAIAQRVLELADGVKGDCWTLLLLLRILEKLHRKIREDLFEESLPLTRQDLYKLLREIDEYGGWPYIERMKLQFLCRNLLENLTPESDKPVN